jgi:hypothetical protein
MRQSHRPWTQTHPKPPPMSAFDIDNRRSVIASLVHQ